MDTIYLVSPNLKQYVTSGGTYTVDTSKLSEPELTRLNAAAATGKLEATQLVSILEDHPNAYQLDVGAEQKMPPPGNVKFKSPEFNKGDEADIDSLVANCFLKGMEVARKLKKTAQEDEQAEVVTKRAYSQEELKDGLDAAEARRKAGVADGAVKIASGAIQIGVAGASLHQLNKSRKAGNEESLNIKESAATKDSQIKRQESHEKQQSKLVKAHDNAKVKHDDAKAAEEKVDVDLQSLRQERINKQKLRDDSEETTVGPDGASAHEKQIAALDAKISAKEIQKVDLHTEVNNNAKLMKDTKAQHAKNEAEHTSFMRDSNNKIDKTKDNIGEGHRKSEYHTQLARTLGALGAPIAGMVEGATKIETANLTFEADELDLQAKFTHTMYEASDLRGQNASGLGSTLKGTMDQAQQTFNTVTSSTQQQLNNTTGHF
jgi:hypothetical protein